MLRIAGIEKDSIVDGEGWRMVLFMQGCKHNCKGCHNPQTHSFLGGKEVPEDELYNMIMDNFKDNPVLDGITLSGGDPFFQSKELLSVCKMIKDNGVNIWAYTGFEFDDIMNINDEKGVTRDMRSLLDYIDVVVDGRFVEDLKTIEMPYRGSKNQRIIDVQKSLKKNTTVEYRIEED